MTGAVRRRALPIGAWSEEERLGWTAAVDLDDHLFSARPRRRWRTNTVMGIQASYGRWLAWSKDDHPELFAMGPAERLTRRTVDLYIEELRGRLADISIGTALIHIRTVVRLLSPGAETSWLRPIVSRLRRTGVSKRRKAERILESGDLLRLGFELMGFDEVPTAANGHASLLRYRDGLIIALLTMRPLRLGNFLSIRLKLHLAERHGKTWLCFPGEETKNGLALELPFPEVLERHLSNYLRIVRTRLLVIAARNGGRGGDRLWLAQTGDPLGRQSLHGLLKRRTVARFGRGLGPHLFRDCLATSLAAAGPTVGWTVPYLLGHRTATSAEKIYTHTEGAPEHAAFHRHLDDLRRRGRVLPRHKSRPDVAG